MPVPILLLIKYKKNTQMWQVEAHLRISFWYLLINLKSNYLLKKLLKWAYKKQTNYNTYNVAFLKKIKKKKPPEYIILHLCTKNLNDMIYNSWDIEHDRLKLVILGHFLLFYQKRTQKMKILKKMKKISGDIIITPLYQKSQSYDLRFLDTDWDGHIFLSFWAIFFSLLP